MSLRDLVDHSQRAFGEFGALPTTDHDQEMARAPVPAWLEPAEVGVREDVFEGDDLIFDIPARGIDPHIVTVHADGFGADALAFYLPYHFFRDAWGIYIWTGGMLHLAGRLKGGPLTPGDEPLISIATHILLEHERLHFMVEVACSRAQLVEGCRLYRDYFRGSSSAHHEEALANAWSFRRVASGESPAIQAAVDRWMSAQGPGYRDYAPLLGEADFEAGRLRTIGNVLAESRIGFRPEALGPVNFLFDNTPRLSVPVRYVADTYGMFRRGRAFPKDYGMRVVVHTNEHPPPHYHIHMPPERHYTRYLWPAHEPFPGDPPLSSAEEKKRARYWEDHVSAIERKIRSVYASTD